MKTKTLNKLTLNQETVRNLTSNEPTAGFVLTHKCPTVGFPVCTPVIGSN